MLICRLIGVSQSFFIGYLAVDPIVGTIGCLGGESLQDIINPVAKIALVQAPPVQGHRVQQPFNVVVSVLNSSYPGSTTLSLSLSLSLSLYNYSTMHMMQAVIS